MKTSATFIIVFFARGQEWKRNKEKKRANVHLLATDAHVIFIGGTFFATPFQHLLQHHFNIASTLLLQHHLLQHHFSTTFIASSFATSLQHHICNIVFCSTASTLLLQHHFNIAFATSSSVALLKHRSYNPILQHCLITFRCYNNIKLLCCNNS
jgi:hypothetical protein